MKKWILLILCLFVIVLTGCGLLGLNGSMPELSGEVLSYEMAGVQVSSMTIKITNLDSKRTVYKYDVYPKIETILGSFDGACLLKKENSILEPGESEIFTELNPSGLITSESSTSIKGVIIDLIEVRDWEGKDDPFSYFK